MSVPIKKKWPKAQPELKNGLRGSWALRRIMGSKNWDNAEKLPWRTWKNLWTTGYHTYRTRTSRIRYGSGITRSEAFLIWGIMTRTRASSRSVLLGVPGFFLK